MTIIESGVIAGIPTGAIIGGAVCKAHGVIGVVGGSLAGMVSGAVVGWLYAFVIICLLSIVGVLWQAARRRADPVPTEAEMDLMTPIGVRGIFIAGLIGLVLWFNFGWLYALVSAFVIGSATAVIAVARCEFGKAL
jgi:hypothetical protein